MADRFKIVEKDGMFAVVDATDGDYPWSRHSDRAAAESTLVARNQEAVEKKNLLRRLSTVLGPYLGDLL